MSLGLSAVLAAAVLSAAPAATSNSRRVAVLDFSASWAGACGASGQGDAERERCEILRLLADQARSGALAVLRPPAFVVMTRENTAQILKDMGGACVEGECEVETARLIGATLVVSGEVSLVEGTYIVSLKSHDVATAALLGTGNVQARTKLELFGNVRAETERMLRASAGLDAASTSSSPPVVVADAPRRERRFYVTAQAGTGFVWGPIEHPTEKMLGDVLLLGRLGFRVNPRWAVEAGAGYINFFKEQLPSGPTGNRLEVKAISYFVATAWRPLPVHPFSFAAELGFDSTSYRYTDDVVGSTTTSSGNLHAGVEARVDWPLGPLELGLRTGVTVYQQPVSETSGTTQWIDSGVFVVLPMTVAVTMAF